ncbi:hypothetical protein SISSUDRAFT_121621 [Sistotremastrum suecicum HHB10207 ss-3]|uniref:F-box domain-containing protein n=1 Tax=Sistotremastrum suecicum HHB10207 ss-3 TaxID=1314776 RepID=A0A166B1G4_9AGAM|nr:hypothetical protein SISSUDRAFT_121621 [Sistotremastrum suecicum HHB10207 ss-3]
MNLPSASEFTPSVRGSLASSFPVVKRRKLCSSSVDRREHLTGIHQLLDIPQDIFFLIASSLEPLDILHLARVCSSLRNTLLSRGARSFWRAARANVDGLPECPIDIPEPVYTRLIFEKDCFLCGRSRAMTVEYSMGKRYCRPCHNNQFKMGRDLLAGPSPVDERILTMIPYSYHYAQYKPVPLIAKYFDQGLFQELVAEMRAAEEDGDSGMFEQFAVQKAADVVRKKKFEEAVYNWITNVRIIRRRKTLNCLEARRSNIQERLLSLGWDRTDFPIHTQTWRRFLNQPRPLTERAWDRMRPDLEFEMRMIKQRRMNSLLQQRFAEIELYYRSLLRNIETARLVPGRSDFQRLPIISGFLNSDSPLPRRLTESAPALMQDILGHRLKIMRDAISKMQEGDAILPKPQLHDDFLGWNALGLSLQGVMHQHLPRGSRTARELADAREVVSQATALFSCSSCRQVFPLDQLLLHLEVSNELFVKHPRAWSPDMLGNAISCRTAAVLLNSMFQQGTPLTLAYMASLGGRFLCMCCPHQTTLPMTWQALVQHFVTNSPSHAFGLEAKVNAGDPTPLCRLLQPFEDYPPISSHHFHFSSSHADFSCDCILCAFSGNVRRQACRAREADPRSDVWNESLALIRPLSRGPAVLSRQP